jgi:hypothetical protein
VDGEMLWDYLFTDPDPIDDLVGYGFEASLEAE